MDPRSWIIKHCAFPEQPEQPSEQPPNTIDINTNEEKPLPAIEQDRDMAIPAGTTLLHGSGEPFEDAELRTGGDGILWTTDDTHGSAMAQSYIPRAGSSTYVTPNNLTRPSSQENVRSLMNYIGMIWDYNDMEFDRTGQPNGWPMPKKPDGTPWDFKQITPETIDQLLKQKGFDLYQKGSSPGYNVYEIKHGPGINDIMTPGERLQGKLFILKVQQPLRIYDYASGSSGDLMSPDYHRYDVFRAAEKAGYDGVRINDYAQVHNHGNVGHQAIGLFAGALPKLKWESIPASHPKMDSIFDTTPEWQAYKSRQRQAWVRGNCKFAK